MNRYTQLLLLFSGLYFSSESCNMQQKAVSANSLSGDIKKESFGGVDSVLTVANGRWTTGSTALVMKDGKVVYDKAFGKKDFEADVNMQRSDIFRIASMSKPIVTAAAMVLVEQNKLNLDDPLSKYVPSFKNMMVIKTFNEADGSYTTEPARAEITIRHLMTHTSGISYSFVNKHIATIYAKYSIPDVTTVRNTTIAETVDKLARLPLAVQPGTEFNYGLSTDVLGRVIEIVSGTSLDKFVTEHILQPLGMNDTYFFLPANKSGRLSPLYFWIADGNLRRITEDQFPDLNYPAKGARTYFSGGSGLCSTTADYSKFLQMILDKGRYRGKVILQPETVTQMTTGMVKMDNNNKFGLGLMLNTEGDEALGIKPGKLSWSGAFNTFFWIDPERRSIAILMTQVYPADQRRILFNGFEKQVNKALDGIEVHAY